jgi:hypothetical protein
MGLFSDMLSSNAELFDKSFSCGRASEQRDVNPSSSCSRHNDGDALVQLVR